MRPRRAVFCAAGAIPRRLRPLPRSAYFLVAANVVPFLGVVLLGWDLGAVMVLFWAENVVVGVFAILRTALVARWLGLFLVPFFTVHYGLFTFAHGMFIFFMFAGDLGPREALVVILPGVVALFVSHGASFVLNFLRGGERQRMRDAVRSLKFRKTGPNSWEADAPPDLERHKQGFLDAGSLMTAPYRRIVVLHVTIIFGGIALEAIGSPMPALALLVALKTGVDLHAHLKERKRAAAHAPATTG